MNKKMQKTSIITILTAFLLSLVAINFLFLFFTQNEVKTIKLLKSELTNLERNEQIIASAQQIYRTYQDEIDIISQVFPGEADIPEVITTFENSIRLSTSEYTFKFNSITPLLEGENLFLPITITMKTDIEKLQLFLDKLENLPYMTHVTSVIAKSPDGFVGLGEVVVSLKMYVKNPFNNQ